MQGLCTYNSSGEQEQQEDSSELNNIVPDAIPAEKKYIYIKITFHEAMQCVV